MWAQNSLVLLFLFLLFINVKSSVVDRKDSTLDSLVLAQKKQWIFRHFKGCNETELSNLSSQTSTKPLQRVNTSIEEMNSIGKPEEQNNYSNLVTHFQQRLHDQL